MKSGLGLLSLLLFTPLCFAAQPDRIPGNIDSNQLMVVPGNVPAQAQPHIRGASRDDIELPSITMLLQPSPAQQAALDRLLAQQQDRASANYHKWLTPEQYADRFGVSPRDMAKIAAWLRVQGFSIVQTARGRRLDFVQRYGRVVETTFRTQIHNYNVDGEMHFANADSLIGSQRSQEW